ncbi:MAG: FKBP-type peptidyl-prolyl cis-trans isomerase [Nanoarchaeota archaeon]
MEIKENDFIELEYDLYANDKLVQTTDEKKGKKHQIKAEKYEPTTIIVGKNFILKALDEDIINNKNPQEEKTLELDINQAYGKRDKKLIKVIPKSAFDEHKTKPVVGVVYDFNGMYGTVKSIIGGRVMVDFNNPLAGKNIKVVYKVTKKIEDIKTKVENVMNLILKIPTNMYKVSSNAKKMTIEVPEQLESIKQMLEKSLLENIPQLSDYQIIIEKLKN